MIYDLTTEMKEVLIEMDFDFFLQKNIAKNNYSQSDIDLIFLGKRKEGQKG